MTFDQCNEALRENLSDSITHALDLRDILGEERDALEHRDTGSLSETAIRKHRCIEKLEALDGARTDMGRSFGVAADADGIASLAARCNEGSKLVASWERFLDVARECSRMNACNGAVIRSRQEQVRAAIRLLREGTTDPETYGPDGQSNDDSQTRTLAEA